MISYLKARRTIREGWHIGPYDYQCGFAFDPKGFFMHKIDDELVSTLCAIRYPNSHSFLGGYIVTDKFKEVEYLTWDLINALE